MRRSPVTYGFDVVQDLQDTPRREAALFNGLAARHIFRAIGSGMDTGFIGEVKVGKTDGFRILIGNRKILNAGLSLPFENRRTGGTV